MEARRGLTLIEFLISLGIISVVILAAIFAYKIQLMKGRDAKRKADLMKLQNTQEDYLNDTNCYPDSLEGICLNSIVPGLPRDYLGKTLCDPIDSLNFNYFYSFDASEACKSWYKIYTRLENEDDPIIEEIGCKDGCGPSNNYNYWVSSSNVTQVAQLPGEIWPEIPPYLTPFPTSEVPIPTGGPTPTTGPTPTEEPTPTPGGPTSTPTPTPQALVECISDPACGWFCALLSTGCGQCCPGTTKECIVYNLQPGCCFTPKCPKP